jgi:hypothetical protein
LVERCVSRTAPDVKEKLVLVRLGAEYGQGQRRKGDSSAFLSLWKTCYFRSPHRNFGDNTKNLNLTQETTKEVTNEIVETTPEHEQLWKATSQVLRGQVSEAVWFSTFNDAVAVADDKMSLRLRVPNTFVRDRILTRYMSLVRGALDEIGASGRELRVDVQTATALMCSKGLPLKPNSHLTNHWYLSAKTSKNNNNLRHKHSALATAKVPRLV